jgi:hypothetical protein
MNAGLRYVLIGIGVLLLLAQFVPVDRTSPPVTGVVDAPEEVMLTLRRSCWDCHSNETRWPWYGYLAPVSWRLSQHVTEGREHVNFTEWTGYDTEDLEEIYEDIADEVREEGMPLKDYLLAHRSAVLSKADRERLITWAETAREGLPGR